MQLFDDSKDASLLSNGALGEIQEESRTPCKTSEKTQDIASVCASENVVKTESDSTISETESAKGDQGLLFKETHFVDSETSNSGSSQSTDRVTEASSCSTLESIQLDVEKDEHVVHGHQQVTDTHGETESKTETEQIETKTETETSDEQNASEATKAITSRNVCSEAAVKAEGKDEIETAQNPPAVEERSHIVSYRVENRTECVKLLIQKHISTRCSEFLR